MKESKQDNEKKNKEIKCRMLERKVECKTRKQHVCTVAKMHVPIPFACIVPFDIHIQHVKQ